MCFNGKRTGNKEEETMIIRLAVLALTALTSCAEAPKPTGIASSQAISKAAPTKPAKVGVPVLATPTIESFDWPPITTPCAGGRLKTALAIKLEFETFGKLRTRYVVMAFHPEERSFASWSGEEPNRDKMWSACKQRDQFGNFPLTDATGKNGVTLAITFTDVGWPYSIVTFPVGHFVKRPRIEVAGINKVDQEKTTFLLLTD